MDYHSKGFELHCLRWCLWCLVQLGRMRGLSDLMFYQSSTELDASINAINFREFLSNEVHQTYCCLYLGKMGFLLARLTCRLQLPHLKPHTHIQGYISDLACEHVSQGSCCHRWCEAFNEKLFCHRPYDGLSVLDDLKTSSPHHIQLGLFHLCPLLTTGPASGQDQCLLLWEQCKHMEKNPKGLATKC